MNLLCSFKISNLVNQEKVECYGCSSKLNYYCVVWHFLDLSLSESREKTINPFCTNSCSSSVHSVLILLWCNRMTLPVKGEQSFEYLCFHMNEMIYNCSYLFLLSS